MWSGAIGSLGRRRITVSTVAMGLLAGLGACSDLSSGTDLRYEGPPEVRQLFLFERDIASKLAGRILAAGTHPDINDGATEGPATAAVINNTQIYQIVLDETIDGRSVERFVCACATPVAGSAADGSSCSNGTAAIVVDDQDPFDGVVCTGCGDNAATTDVDETNACRDINQDQLPDTAEFIPDLITTDCGVAAYDGGNTEVSARYSPSGNQLIPTEGTIGIGPAIFVRPRVPMPAGSSCTITLASSIVDHDGEAIQVESGVSLSFTSEPVLVTSSTPAAAATGVSATANLVGNLNTNITPPGACTATGTVHADCAQLVTLTTGGNPVAVDVSVAAIPGTPANPSRHRITINPQADLTAGTAYVLTFVASTTEDTFGINMTSDAVVNFTTAP